MPASFFFLRHGESENNLKDLVNGQTDSLLTEGGRRQAHAAGLELNKCGVAAIVCSPLRRARETAEIVDSYVGVGIRVLAGLKERNWGCLENRPRYMLEDYFSVPEGAESWEEYRARVWRTISAAGLQPGSLICGHAGTMRVLRDALGIGDVKGRLPNAVPVQFERSQTETWTCTVLSEA